MNLRLRRARTLARLGAVIGIGVLVYYLVTLVGGHGFPLGALIYVAIIGASAYAAWQSVDDPYRARRLLILSTVGFAVVGLVAITSIGVLFLLAGLYTGIAAVLTPRSPLGD